MTSLKRGSSLPTMELLATDLTPSRAHAHVEAGGIGVKLGHAAISMTTDVYFGRNVATTDAAAVLEALGS